LDTIAEKISYRIGGARAAPQSPGGHGTWAVGVRSGTATLDGASTATIKRPDPPSFLEAPVDQSKPTLPPALMGGHGSTSSKLAVKPAELPPTINDVNYFTQEKMRGDCYVRLLIRPDANAARKDPIPYVGQPMVPDQTLVMGVTRPMTIVPPRPARPNEDGEMEEDDEFENFDRNDAVVFSFVRHNRFEAVQAILEQERETLAALDDNGNTLLHIACQNNNRRIAKLLLKNGASVNAQNKRGNTPLHYCHQYGFMQMGEYLIQLGADGTIVNQAGMAPSQGTGRADDAVAQTQRQLATERQGANLGTGS